MSDAQNTHPDVVERLTRMETKLDLTLVGLNDVTKDHEQRLRSVESQVTSISAIGRWKATTGISVLLAGIAAGIQLFSMFS